MNIGGNKYKQGKDQNSNQDLAASSQSILWALNPRLTNLDSATRGYTTKKCSKPTCSDQDAKSPEMW